MPEASPYTAQAPQTEAGITLQAQDLGYRRGKRWLVRGVSLRLEGGQFWALLGPMGRGKPRCCACSRVRFPPTRAK